MRISILKYLFVFTLLIGCETIPQPSKAQISSTIAATIGINNNQPVFVIFTIGQSNAVSRAEADRLLQLTTYPDAPSGIKIYYKPAPYSSSPNGGFYPLYIRGPYTKEPDQSGTSFGFGAYNILASNIKKVTSSTVYIVMMGDGGTALQQNLTNPDWDPTSVGECFQTAMEWYYQAAYPVIVAENPGKIIIPIIDWYQGETDAADATATANYSSNLNALITAIRASHSSLASAQLYISTLNYNQSAGETTINNVFYSYQSAHPSNTVVIDMSAQKRKSDLTTGEKGGITPTYSDDIHISYLGQIYRGVQMYADMKQKYFSSLDDSDITNNTGFDPSTLVSTGVRLQFNSSNATYTSKYELTGLTNNLSTGSFTSFNGSPLPRLHMDRRKGLVSF